MSKFETDFSPARNGFQFPNRFEFHFPIKYPLPFGGAIDLNDVVFGLCGGMSFAALDYFFIGEPLPAYNNPQEIDQKLFTYLCDRQLDSLKIPVLLKVIEWMLLENRDIALRMSRVEVPKLRRLLEKGEPAVLALIRVQGIGDPTKNHQVLATACEFDEATKNLTVSLYDPNHPGEEPSIKLNLAKPGAGIDISQSTGEALRGFFIIPYSPSRTVPAAAPQVPAKTISLKEALEPAFALQWPVDSRRVNQYFGEHPKSYKPFGLPGHEGLDLFAITGANVYAAAGGKVYQAGHPANHPYGLHIRIRHEFNGKVYHTIYAHLSDAFVQVGQSVSAGDRIGLADNTGNSFGSHLHLTLKIDGQQTPGYPAGVVDPWPYLQGAGPAPVPPLPPPSGIKVYTTGQVNLRLGPDTASQIVTILPSGEALSVLGDASQVRGKIGVQDQWLQVLTAGGEDGYVAAWLVQSIEQTFPPSDLVVYPFDVVNLRSGPGTAFGNLAALTLNDPLTVLGDAGIARSKVGRQGEWLQVLTEAGMRGFVAAWLVHLTGQVAPSTDLVVYPTDIVNIRARPQLDGNILTTANPDDPLAVLGDKDGSRLKIGMADQWLNVRTPQKYAGFVAAWLVQLSGPAPVPPPADITGLTVYPTTGINLRAQASVNSPRIDGAVLNEALKVVETDLKAAKDKIGKMDMWIYAEKQNGVRGWAAAWYLSPTPV